MQYITSKQKPKVILWSEKSQLFKWPSMIYSQVCDLILWGFLFVCTALQKKKINKPNQPNCSFPLCKTLIPGPRAAHSRVPRWAIRWLEQNSWIEKEMLGLWPTVHCTQVIHIYYSCCNTDFRILINDVVRSWGHCLLLHLSLSNQNSSLNKKTK